MPRYLLYRRQRASSRLDTRHAGEIEGAAASRRAYGGRRPDDEQFSAI